MNISDRLTPEERELARLLGRPTHSEHPGADLDARILSMATKPLPAAAATAPHSVRRSGWSRRRGVPSSLAVAASLVLVVGLAWQLRPTPPPAPDLHPASADSTVVPAAAPPSAEASADPTNARDAASTVPMPAAAPAVAEAAEEKASTEKSAASHATAAATKARTAKAVEPQVRAAHEAVVRSAPAYDTAPPIAPPSPPAPPAMAPQSSEQFGAQADSGAAPLAETTARMAPPRPEPSAAPRLSRAAPQSVENEQVEPVQQQLQSDIESDAALSRRHWLKRIRERRDAGDLAGARLSLRRFVQDYPEANIPRDLRPMLQD